MPSVGSSSQQSQNLVPALPGDRRFNAAMLVLWALTKVLLDKFFIGRGTQQGKTAVSIAEAIYS